jgi:hypothetical protein
MFSINAIGAASLSYGNSALPSQGDATSADSGSMDPISGIDASMSMANITTQAQGGSNDIDAAQMKLMVDTMKDSGAQIVNLLENLGQNVDLYA